MFNPFQVCLPISGLPSFSRLMKSASEKGVGNKIVLMCLINWESYKMNPFYLEFIFNHSYVIFMNECWLVSCQNMKTIKAFIYPDKLCRCRYLSLMELMGIFTSPQHTDPLNLVHNVNYTLRELLPCTYLWCLLFGFVYTWVIVWFPSLPLDYAPFKVAEVISMLKSLICGSLLTLISWHLIQEPKRNLISEGWRRLHYRADF